MTTPAPCPFCFPAEERIAFEDRLTRALWDAFPVSEGHLLLVPRRHVPTWFDATAEEKAALTAGLDRGRELIASHHRPDGFNIGINVGKAAGQTVFHLHVHLIPRYAESALRAFRLLRIGTSRNEPCGQTRVGGNAHAESRGSPP